MPIDCESSTMLHAPIQSQQRLWREARHYRRLGMAGTVVSTLGGAVLVGGDWLTKDSADFGAIVIDQVSSVIGMFALAGGLLVGPPALLASGIYASRALYHRLRR